MNHYKNRMSTFRLAVFPIANSELGKFIPMSIILFCTIFSFWMLRILKDPLILTAPGSGAEVLSFLKLYVALPCTMISMIIYMKMRKAFSLESTYYIISAAFVFFFLFFSLVLYPYHDLLHPPIEVVQALKNSYPVFRWFFVIYGVWTFSLFYVVSELWGTFLLTVMFWQFANDNILTEEAKRYYPLFITIGNVAMLVLKPAVQLLISTGGDDILHACIVVCISALIQMALLYYINRKVLPVPKFKDRPYASKKNYLSLRDSIRVLLHSEYIGYVAIMILSYGVTINLVEAMWKSQVRLVYPNRAALMAFNAEYTFWMGGVTILMNYTSKGLIRKLGWKVGALITPLVCGFFGTIFYVFVLSKHMLFATGLHGNSLLMMTVWVGGFSVLMSKGSKYSFFDPTKEMAFIPLDVDLRTNGKAAADGFGERLGKSLGGGLISSLIIMTGQDLDGLSHILALVVVALSVFWFLSVHKLSVLYQNKLREQADAQHDVGFACSS